MPLYQPDSVFLTFYNWHYSNFKISAVLPLVILCLHINLYLSKTCDLLNSLFMSMLLFNTFTKFLNLLLQFINTQFIFMQSGSHLLKSIFMCLWIFNIMKINIALVTPIISYFPNLIQ